MTTFVVKMCLEDSKLKEHQANIAQIRSDHKECEERLKREHAEEVAAMTGDFHAIVQGLNNQIQQLQEEVGKYKTLAGIEEMTQDALRAAEKASREAGLHQGTSVFAVTGTPNAASDSAMHNGQAIESTKPIVQPKSPMKPLFWKRIQVHSVKTSRNQGADNSNLFWEEIVEEPINVDNFEALFAKVPVESKRKTNANKSKAKVVQISSERRRGLREISGEISGVTKLPKVHYDSNGDDGRFNSPTDVQKCILWLNGKKWTVYNVYNPPANTCRIDDLQENIYHNTILAGDFNGHSLLWGYQDTNNTGKYLEEVCTTTNLSIQQNENSPPTLLHRAHNILSRPDLTVMSPDLENDSEIRVLPDMGSDHRPTLITIRQNGIPPRQQRSRWNFKKADWEGFRATSEREFRNNSWEDDIDGLEETFTSTIFKNSNLHIPKGLHQKYKPFWNEEIEAAVSSRRQARIELEACPTIASKKNYNKATAVVKRVIATAQIWIFEKMELRHRGR
ncbi:RNA-directed DNA polymerase from mobile element jockey [Elysia marginata]|uniref:RNA-directed DNA polymerase from mobile element jockey n=1 Tax=Elysia marginata TaxID=1093978 RepID=A0AAV4EY17_9GAST|nr:RNA-directed DNA polymerase from mobile element jockey [Elysia marginata]